MRMRTVWPEEVRPKIWKKEPLEVVMSVVMKIRESVGGIGLGDLEKPWNGCMWSSCLLLSY